MEILVNKRTTSTYFEVLIWEENFCILHNLVNLNNLFIKWLVCHTATTLQNNKLRLYETYSTFWGKHLQWNLHLKWYLKLSLELTLMLRTVFLICLFRANSVLIISISFIMQINFCFWNAWVCKFSFYKVFIFDQYCFLLL